MFARQITTTHTDLPVLVNDGFIILATNQGPLESKVLQRKSLEERAIWLSELRGAAASKNNCGMPATECPLTKAFATSSH